ncbi:hypothetical protein C471_01559 [Halorubrum saccharovorum DSM 1137]|uniref:Uncharacterized protein n=1 Tax=Halorubrum saccharovorum DSM 1137 TaxID=1227484 RepID=M0E7X1_9EURY|nr:hypothetical protein [Halorubrum saccharovorum]ELZ43103.1 hypothetical protein C471_01559 [Halorubrum saccharovorum DSM 1137]
MTRVDRSELRSRLKAVLADRFGDDETEVIAHAAVDYPYCRVDSLPETLEHDFAQLRDDYTADEIRDVLEALATETDLFSLRDEDGGNGLDNRMEIGDDAEFVDRLERHVLGDEPDRTNGDETARETRADATTVFDDLRQYHDRYLERRVDRRAETIPIASHHRSTESFKRDLDLSRYNQPNELCIPTFSFETMPDFVVESIERWIENGLTVKVLLFGEETGASLEYGRVKDEIRKGEEKLRSLQERTASAPGELKYRKASGVEHTHFRGLLVRSENDDECSYRFFVLDDRRERGVNSAILRGRDRTTIFRTLDDYFDRAWRAARPPGWRGIVKANSGAIGLGVAIAVFVVAVYGWFTRTIPARIAEPAIAVTIAIILTIIEEKYLDAVF